MTIIVLFLSIFSKWTPNQEKDLMVRLRLLKNCPSIDGILKNEEWANGCTLGNFTQYQPIENIRPPVDTKVLLGYFGKSLYIGFICYDNPNTVQKTLVKRDKFELDDMVFIGLSPYRNLNETLIFATNPVGVPYDGVRNSEGIEDYSFDAEFKVSANVYRNFWVAEFQIPFRSLKFSCKGNVRIWRVQFVRQRPRNSVELYYWAPVSRSNPSLMSQAGYLILPDSLFLETRRVDFIPFSLLSVEDNNKYIYSGFNIKCDFIGMNTEMTFNPDYAQIETDAPQIDVNTSFALFYPEKRPFFMEGKTLFETPINAIYTKSINDPLYAVKLTGRFNKYDIGFISAYDEHSPYTIPFEEASFSIPSDKKSFSNIFRIKRDLFEESHIGLLFATRDVEKSFNRIAGIDTRLRFLTHYTLNYQYVYSCTKEPSDTLLSESFNSINFDKYTGGFDGEKLYGYAQELNFNAYFRNFIGNIWFGDYSPCFRSDLGFIKRNNFREIEIRGGPRGFPNKYGLTEISLWLWHTSNWNYDNILKERSNAISLYLSGVGQTTIITKYSRIKKRYSDKYFPDLWDYNTSIYTSPLKYFSLNFYFDISKTISY